MIINIQEKFKIKENYGDAVIRVYRKTDDFNCLFQGAFPESDFDRAISTTICWAIQEGELHAIHLPNGKIINVFPEHVIYGILKSNDMIEDEDE